MTTTPQRRLLDTVARLCAEPIRWPEPFNAHLARLDLDDIIEITIERRHLDTYVSALRVITTEKGNIS